MSDTTAVSKVRPGTSARSISEPHRTSSSLELLFDLTFVVAVGGITIQLAHGLANGDAAAVIPPFLEVFFSIWWAWMNFTWFGSSYNIDDPLSRLMTLVQMGGVLVLSAGIPAAFSQVNFTAVTVGYLIMRVGLVVQWLRAAAANPGHRQTALRYATGITVLQACWVVELLTQAIMPAELWFVNFLVLAVAEMSVPLWAERTGHTTWHPHHIADRYGLFVIILLGESVLASTNGVAEALNESGVSPALVVVAASGLVLLFALWWLYFLEPAGYGLEKNRDRSFWWGYGHYAIFASLAALAAGLKVAIGDSANHGPAIAVGYGVAIPASAFLVLVWLAHRHVSPGAPPVTRGTVILPACAAVMLTPQIAAGIGIPADLTVIAGTCVLVVVVSLSLSRTRTPAG